MGLINTIMDVGPLKQVCGQIVERLGSLINIKGTVILVVVWNTRD